jgi:hypothetical protein
VEELRLSWRAHRAAAGGARLFIGVTTEAQMGLVETAMGSRCAGVPWGSGMLDGREVPLRLVRMAGRDWVEEIPAASAVLAPGWAPVTLVLRLAEENTAPAIDAFARGARRPCMFLAGLGLTPELEGALNINGASPISSTLADLAQRIRLPAGVGAVDR